ncbi:hypothetical protein SAMN05444050_6398 [Afipia sp. GAS231]|nr:hypothetical protein SAMN05444050_6398 [Afipia sp. GAS231]
MRRLCLVDPDGRLWRPGAALTHHPAMLNGGLGLLEVECNCRKGRYAPPMHIIKLTGTQQITPYKWVRPERGAVIGQDQWLPNDAFERSRSRIR